MPPLSIEEVYKLLDCDKHYKEKTGVSSFTQSFKANPNVYKVAGLDLFEKRSEESKRLKTNGEELTLTR